MTGVGSAVTPGRCLGRYELLCRLARGGMADIFLARQRRARGPARQVAVKVLSKARATDPEARAMFLDEARLVAMLDHDNIAAAVEVDEVDGNHYLAMEYIAGADLRAVLAAAERARTPLPLDAAVSIVSAAAAGLDHAHRRCGPDGKPLDIVHCDVSLSNVMVGHGGAVKVVDFGIATTSIASVRALPGMVRGKASYMSPEQCLGDAVDHRSDVFGLGVVLYELTTGTRCFHGKTDFDRMLAVVRGDYTAPCDLIASYPRDLDRVVRTALATSPARRFASAAAMIEALAEVTAAHAWPHGPQPIQCMMRALFGDPSAPAASHHDDGPATESASIMAAAEPTARERRPVLHACSDGRGLPPAVSAAGGQRGLIDGPGLPPADDLDERTRGRGPLRRLRSSVAA